MQMKQNRPQTHHAFVNANIRFKDHYYYDEFTGEWFYIVDVRWRENMWIIDLVKHTITGWKRVFQPEFTKATLDARHFADAPFVVTDEDLQK